MVEATAEPKWKRLGSERCGAPAKLSTMSNATEDDPKLYLCVVPSGGVAYRNSPAMDDRCEDGTDCEKDASVEAAEVRSSSVDGAAAWIQAKHKASRKNVLLSLN